MECGRRGHAGSIDRLPEPKVSVFDRNDCISPNARAILFCRSMTGPVVFDEGVWRGETLASVY